MTSGPQRVNVTQLNITQLSQLKQSMDQEIDLFTSSLQQLKSAENKFRESANNVESLRPDGDNAVNKQLLVPLSSSMYVPGRIRDAHKVIIEIGTGYYVGMDFDKAAAYFARKIEFVTLQMNKVQDAGQEKLKIRSLVEDVLQTKLHMQLQQGQTSKSTMMTAS